MPDKPQALADHLSDLQNAAYVAESLLSVIVACGDHPKRKQLIITAAEAAQEIILELGRGLDSVEIMKISEPSAA
jgi:hypothetical protein